MLPGFLRLIHSLFSFSRKIKLRTIIFNDFKITQQPVIIDLLRPLTEHVYKKIQYFMIMMRN